MIITRTNFIEALRNSLKEEIKKITLRESEEKRSYKKARKKRNSSWIKKQLLMIKLAFFALLGLTQKVLMLSEQLKEKQKQIHSCEMKMKLFLRGIKRLKNEKGSVVSTLEKLN